MHLSGNQNMNLVRNFEVNDHYRLNNNKKKVKTGINFVSEIQVINPPPP